MSKNKSSSKHKQKKEETATVAEAISKSEEFLNKYKKHIIFTVIGIIVLLGLFFGYTKLIRDPRREEALSQMFPAEQYFRADSFNLALNGDGNILGFKDIIKDYKKAAILMEEKGDYTGALDLYNTIKIKYPYTIEGMDIDKYISRLEVLMQ
jgi:uncharacterized membrane protein